VSCSVKEQALNVFALIGLLIANLLVAGCAGAAQIYLELMLDLMGSSEHPQEAHAVQGASGRR
jgi:hypothetical protein